MDPADGEPSLSTSELYLWSSPCQPHLQSSQLLPERLLLPESKKKKNFSTVGLPVIAVISIREWTGRWKWEREAHGVQQGAQLDVNKEEDVA